MQKLFDTFYGTFIQDNRWTYFYDGFFMTLILTLSSFTVGSIIGAAFCVLKFSKYKKLVKVVDIVVNFFVQLPTLVLLMIMVYIVFGNTSLSTVIIVIIGLSIKTGSYMCEIFYSAVNSTQDGEVEAARALGMNQLQAFTYVTLPQAVSNSIDVYKNQFVTTLQETSVVSSLAVQELTKASNVVTSRTLDAFFCLICISILYIIIGKVGGVVLGTLENKKHLGETVNA